MLRGGVRVGREEGKVRAWTPPPATAGKLIPVACALRPHPEEVKGAPKQGGEDADMAGSRRRYSLEAQQTNTFILRHFQCRL